MNKTGRIEIFDKWKEKGVWLPCVSCWLGKRPRGRSQTEKRGQQNPFSAKGDLFAFQ